MHARLWTTVCWPAYIMLGCLLFVGLPLARSQPGSSTTAPPAENLSVASCDPCRLKIAQALAPYSVRFIVNNVQNERRVIESLQVSRDDAPGWTQSLPVHDMTPVRQNEEFFLATADINFDGFNDLLLATSRGVANTYAAYWLFVPSTEGFFYLGNYPIFTLNTDERLLSTYERGGDGGMIYQANRYRFVDGVLTLVESEKQERGVREGTYRKSFFRLKGGKLHLVKREVIKAPSPK